MSATSPETLAEWRRLCEAATPVPWGHSPGSEGHYVIGGPLNCRIVSTSHDDRWGELDAAFIAASRTAMPALLDEVERLIADRAAVQASHDEMLRRRKALADREADGKTPGEAWRKACYRTGLATEQEVKP